MKAVYFNRAVIQASGVLAALLLSGAASRADEVTVTSVGIIPAYNTWIQDDTRPAGIGAVTGTYAHTGDGSYQMTTGPSTTPGYSDAKSSASFYWQANNAAANPFGTVTTVASLQNLSYDWFRSSSSTVTASAMPALRFYFSNPNGTQTGSLVYEFAYNSSGSAPLDQWTHVTMVSTNTLLWMRDTTPLTGTGNIAYPDATYSLADWTNSAITKNDGSYTIGSDWLVTGVTASFGSGIPGVFSGAIDNVTIGFNGAEHNYNFNLTAVPEPGTLALGGLGMAGLVGWCIRRRQQASR